MVAGWVIRSTANHVFKTQYCEPSLDITLVFFVSSNAENAVKVLEADKLPRHIENCLKAEALRLFFDKPRCRRKRRNRRLLSKPKSRGKARASGRRSCSSTHLI
jgi:hypothetical protein